MRENIWKNIKLGFKTNKLAVAGAAAIILLALISIFAFLYPVDPNAISATERLNAPSMAGASSRNSDPDGNQYVTGISHCHCAGIVFR